MDKKIVQIDLSKVDAEILEIDQELKELALSIKRLENERTEKVRFKEFILANMDKYGKPLDIVPKITMSKGKHDISDFVLNYLRKYGNVKVSSLIESYASDTGKDSNLARSNVSNALTRLKGSGKVENEKDDNGKSIWRLKKSED
ncbi:hypothetical protein [Chitinophaga qingshengii]|uniref:ArsR family transcriptional regulator n=1 Tax=Chitinophaga qingshengii TaxID=1569794 RepID=A0ABR7THL5_9BACT|nr:hypothetical protein [Chitinophaga qingshengii]MBC9930001.1 hypothetical protein [Chitinophaga qingshengii]